MTWAPCPHGVRTRGKKVQRLALLESVSCTFSMFWTTVTSQTSSEKRRTNKTYSQTDCYVWLKRDSQKGRTRFRVFTW